MTLTELLVASILVGVVILGAVSSDYAIRTWQKRIEQRTMVQMDLARAMEQIVNGGRQTTGNGILNINMFTFVNNPDQGVSISYSTTQPIYIAFKHDLNWVLFHCGQDSEGPPYINRYIYMNGVWGPASTIFTPSVMDFFSLTLDSGKLQSININLATRPNPEADKNDLTNPEYTLSTSFLPPGLSQ